MRKGKQLRQKLRRQNIKIGSIVSQKPFRSLLFTTLASVASGITIGYLIKHK